MQRTHLGVDADPVNLMLHELRAGLADLGVMLIATELQDVLLGTPKPVRSYANLGVLKENMVNIVVHGHVPLLSDKIVEAAQLPEMQEEAKKVGAEGINVVGICCTANEVFARRGVPIAGNFLQQELAIITGAVEAMVVDVQCIMPSLPQVASCFHTKIVTTMPQGKIPGAEHIEFVDEKADEIAKQIVRLAIENYKNRDPSKVNIPSESIELMGGFSVESILSALGGSLDPLIDAIKEGKIYGIVAIVGCNNPKIKHDYGHVRLAEKLIENNILVVGTGCWASAAAKAGLMVPEAASKAGSGLAEVCKALGIPSCLHMGSCVDNSRIFNTCSAIAQALGVDISDLPIAAAAPEWMSEKSIAIGTWAISAGVFTVLGPVPPVLGSKKVTEILTKDVEDLVGAKFAVEPDPEKAAELILEHIKEKRAKLGLKT